MVMCPKRVGHYCTTPVFYCMSALPVVFWSVDIPSPDLAGAEAQFCSCQQSNSPSCRDPSWANRQASRMPSWWAGCSGVGSAPHLRGPALGYMIVYCHCTPVPHGTIFCGLSSPSVDPSWPSIHTLHTCSLCITPDLADWLIPWGPAVTKDAITSRCSVFSDLRLCQTPNCILTRPLWRQHLLQWVEGNSTHEVRLGGWE